MVGVIDNDGYLWVNCTFKLVIKGNIINNIERATKKFRRLDVFGRVRLIYKYAYTLHIITEQDTEYLINIVSGRTIVLQSPKFLSKGAIDLFYVGNSKIYLLSDGTIAFYQKREWTLNNKALRGDHIHYGVHLGGSGCCFVDLESGIYTINDDLTIEKIDIPERLRVVKYQKSESVEILLTASGEIFIKGCLTIVGISKSHSTDYIKMDFTNVVDIFMYSQRQELLLLDSSGQLYASGRCGYCIKCAFDRNEKLKRMCPGIADLSWSEDELVDFGDYQLLKPTPVSEHNFSGIFIFGQEVYLLDVSGNLWSFDMDIAVTGPIYYLERIYGAPKSHNMMGKRKVFLSNTKSAK